LAGMVSKTFERITELLRASTYDKAAWILLAALIAVLGVLWNCSSIASHFAVEQYSIKSIEDYITLGAFVAEIVIFLFTFIVLTRKPYYKRKSTWTVAMVTYFGCFALGAITLIAIGLADIHYNC
jgi:hypothetical protein